MPRKAVTGVEQADPGEFFFVQLRYLHDLARHERMVNGSLKRFELRFRSFVNGDCFIEERSGFVEFITALHESNRILNFFGRLEHGQASGYWPQVVQAKTPAPRPGL